MPDTSKPLVCAFCRKAFLSSMSDEEALAQLAQEFPDVPVEDCDIVCDDCFKAWERQGGAASLVLGQPGYWMHETSGRLQPAVLALIRREPLTPEQVALLRAYFRQWIAAPGFRGPEVEALRESVNDLCSRDEIEKWLIGALAAGADPL